MGDILTIRMQTPGFGTGDPCFVCGEPCSGFHGLPTFNGDVMSNDWPGEWFGRSCCEACYERHLAGKMPTADPLYRHRLNDLGFIHGSGI